MKIAKQQQQRQYHRKINSIFKLKATLAYDVYDDDCAAYDSEGQFSPVRLILIVFCFRFFAF